MTANIYCNQRLDELLAQAIAPLWTQLQFLHDKEDCFLWFTRYARRGEHLKLRVHGSARLAEEVRGRLEAEVSRFFGTLVEIAPSERIVNSQLPPIDVEDGSEGEAPDRSLLWTTYSRSPAVLGAESFVRDAEHSELFTRAMAECARLILVELAPDMTGQAYAQKRQSLFLKMLIAGISEASDAPAFWITYLTYHRDWLVRYFVANGDPHKVSHASILEDLEQKLAKSSSAIAPLGALIAAHAGLDPVARYEGSLGGWRSGVAAFFRHIAGYRGQPEYDLDPYAADSTHLPLFKLLHGCANQLGFRMSNEAYLHHLLLRAAGTWTQAAS
ncbi:hypothetical protein G4177_15120 [Corallococcus sp. ZKHCc1 1396]|uniref:Thiopeptide-type bacteriocin biosynthesis domain-containing protein n=1 Tax=Corallococcus soli TaxID=2710757 RepID=A0ABR9PNK2_9BACT|nr:hypothetical protein [Corallococcus soli]